MGQTSRSFNSLGVYDGAQQCYQRFRTVREHARNSLATPVFRHWNTGGPAECHSSRIPDETTLCPLAIDLCVRIRDHGLVRPGEV